jgi:hypothetical protein
VFGLIEATTKRLEKTALLTAFLLLVIRRSAAGDAASLLQSVYLCINRVRAPATLLTRARADHRARSSRRTTSGSSSGSARACS